MDFELSKEQMDIKKAAREFAEKEFPEVGRECDIKKEFPFDLWKKASGLGLIGVYIPEAYGGAGYGITEHCCVSEEFWRVDPGCGQCMASAVIGAEVILMLGNEDQKKLYLNALVSGEKLMGIAITEPEAGSDALSASTTAVREGDHYILEGHKTFITNGDIAGFLVVFCVTNPDAKKKTDRFSMIIVETDRPGYESKKLKDKLGIRASNTSEVWFNRVRVPKENLIGKEGSGAEYLMRFFDRSRIMVAASGVGLAQGAMERAIKHMDRSVDTIKHKGYRIAASEIEAALQEHPAVIASCVVGVPDSKVGERIKAFVILKEDVKGITGFELIKWCRTRLAPYKIPQYIEFRDMLPKSKVGKLLRREVRSEEARRAEG